MTSTKHRRSCAASGCHTMVSANLLMCVTHWRLVPAPVQREVLAAYRGRDAGPAAFGAYQEAVARAVQAVNQKLEARAAQPGKQRDLLG